MNDKKKDMRWCSKHQTVHPSHIWYRSCRFPNQPICPFKLCFISQEPQKNVPCEFAIKNEQGNPDCGHG